MNKIYKVVWSKVKHCYVVTSELAKRNGKGCGARSLRMTAVSMGVAATLIGGVCTPVEAATAATMKIVVVSDNTDYNALYSFQGEAKSVTVDQDAVDKLKAETKYFFGNVAVPTNISSTDTVTYTVIDG